LGKLIGVLPVTALREWFREERVESGFEGWKFDTVLGTFWSSHAGSDGCQIEFDNGGEGEGVLLGRDSEKILGAVVVLD
jgi:hypothetical protein